MLQIYTTEFCPQCKVVKSYLMALGVSFQEVLVNTPEMIEEIVNLTGQRTVPVIRSEKGLVVGLNFDKIKEMI